MQDISFSNALIQGRFRVPQVLDIQESPSGVFSTNGFSLNRSVPDARHVMHDDQENELTMQRKWMFYAEHRLLRVVGR